MNKPFKIECVWTCPAVHAPDRVEIPKGTQLVALKKFFSNGEHHFKLKTGGSVPSVFFKRAK